ncbi:LacI family DNA-binding transcriptional regulator [Candidatus Hakubella thermalkaliphila]|uniref:LacI family transcriptional regulator n=2 Tax=Candidatus Hakubella thermalkaliphila TaxID=2754717 RepID=A0A6V8P5Y5_9ACTN|nr:LacI family DNA-binding transcriptional regulator [Candidatus Hakubella thermalkaliphila]GFP27828.1 LacI family transcriptional regulator [Candidatus Hakubella thermalkaliphila]
MTTIKDLAKMANVSVATVSRVINKSGYVSPELTRRVGQAIAESGYQVNALARSLKTAKTHTIGLIIADISNPFFTSVIRGVEDIAYKHGYNLILCNTDENLEKEKLYLQVLRGKMVDGLIISPAVTKSEGIRELLRRHPNVVFMDRKVEEPEVICARVDNVKGTKMAIDYLLQLGHKDIAIISGPLNVTSGVERYQGYVAALKEAGLEPRLQHTKIGTFRQESGYKLAQELLDLERRPSALFVANNVMTIGALLAIRERGLSIPDDISVVGFDDMDWAVLANPPLTTVAQPTYEMGVKAMELLIRQMHKEKIDQKEILLSPELRVRESCKKIS